MLSLLASCALLTDEFHTERVDADADGAIARAFGGTDCDDTNPAVHPDAAETCDGLDQDCDGTADDGVTLALYTDADGDGFGDVATLAEACAPGEDQVLDGTDCDDTDPMISPTAREICNGIDDDCDGTRDEDQQIGAVTYYRDADGDGYGTDETIDACALPPGYAGQAGDCDDSEAATNPGAVEDCSNSIDLNCDGYAGTDDQDGDGFPACEECNDGNGAVNPDAVEVCNDRDDDCDGDIDGDATDAGTWYADVDGDGWGAGEGTVACDTPGGFVSVAGDCEDADAGIHPSADEDCDSGADANCDGSVGGTDSDGDGHQACDECDDTDAAVFPGATEVCNGVDDDCSGDVDGEAVDLRTWYTDADGDGYGSGAVQACTQPAGTSAADGDCDDGDALVGVATVWYSDVDGDGFGGEAYDACDGEVAVGGDCDDADAAVFPGAAEYCDGDDEDCDGTEDGAIDAPTWCEDADLDGYCGTVTVVQCDSPGSTWSATNPDGDCDDLDASAGVASTWCEDADLDGYCGTVTVTRCDSPGATWSTTNPDGDCDEGDSTVSPGGVEVCDDGVDQDCDGSASGCGIVSSGTVGDADASFVGEVGQATGYALDAGQDLDGDGRIDLVVSMPNWSGVLGAVLLLEGPPASITHADQASVRFHEPTATYFGLTTKLIPDLDYDGDAELLVREWGTTAWIIAGADFGATGTTYLVDDSSAFGRLDFSASGWSPTMAVLSDADGDGSAELVLADQTSPAVVYVVGGEDAATVGPVWNAATATITAADADDAFGYSLAELGDTDGDGLREFAAGAPEADDAGIGAGAFYVFPGNLTDAWSATDADILVTGTGAGDALGTQIASAGDTDGDGKADVLVTSADAARLFLGPVSGATTEIEAIPSAALSAGDVNADGAVDIAATSPTADTAKGRVYLFLGPIDAGTLGTGDADVDIAGTTVDDYTGNAVTLEGDLDADGYADLLFGAAGGSTSLSAAYLFYGGWY